MGRNENETSEQRTRRIMERVAKECRTTMEEQVDQHMRFDAARQAIVSSVQAMLLDYGGEGFDLEKHMEHLAVLVLAEQAERDALKKLLFPEGK